MSAKGIYIKDIAPNTQIEGLFLVKDKNSGTTKNGKPYLALNLTDRTGEVKARIWDRAETLGERFIQGQVVQVKANTILYQGVLQLNIHDLVRTESDDSATLGEFLPSSPFDPDEMISRMMSLIQTVENRHLRRLLEIFFSDTDIMSAFKAAPAAKSVHHDYISGLLEHTLSVACLGADVVKHYPKVDRDLLLTGAILHDIGKISELSYRQNFDYSDEGRLIGHIVIGVEMISSKLALLPDFPADMADVLKHMILSHHGQYEYGSPKRPKTLEALLLSYLDDMDAKMHAVTRFITNEKRADSKWSSYHRLFDRYFYTESFQDDEGPPDDPPKPNVAG